MNKRKMTVIKKNNEGFSLFELLIAVSIIGILTALAVASYSNAQKKGRDVRRVQDIKTIQTAAEQFYSQNNYVYPTTTLATGWTSPGGQALLNVFPLDPKNDSTYYYSYSIGTTYCACAQVENVLSGNATDRSCTFNVGATGNYFCVRSQQ